jgi:hypothetical protein
MGVLFRTVTEFCERGKYEAKGAKLALDKVTSHGWRRGVSYINAFTHSCMYVILPQTYIPYTYINIYRYTFTVKI